MAEENKNPQPEGAKKPEQKGAPRRRYRTVAFARVYVNCSFNNTMVTFTDEKGGVIAWSTSGGNGFRGTKKGTPFAAGVTATKIAKRALEMGVKQVSVFIKGPGPGRETAVRSLGNAGLIIISLKDVTPLPHNGCRPPKARRV